MAISSASSSSNAFFHLSANDPLTTHETRRIVALAEKIMSLASDKFSQIPTTEIFIENDPCFPSAASSIPKKNIVCWNVGYQKDHPSSDSVKIFWLIIEKLNVISCKKFEFLNELVKNGDFSKDQFVELWESVEHQNAIYAQDLLNRAADLEMIEPSGFTQICKDFSLYYMMQQYAGHTDHISAAYDQLCQMYDLPITHYNGTFPISIENLNEQENKDILFLFDCKRLIKESEGMEFKNTLMFIVLNMQEPGPIAETISLLFSKELSGDFS